MTDELKNENVNNEQNDTPNDHGAEQVLENSENTENKNESEQVVGGMENTATKKVEEKKEEGESENKDEKLNKKDFKKPFRKNFRRRSNFKREKPEFEQKILSLRRVTRVMAGGRRFSFSVAMVVGDKNGRVGIGMGKSNDTTMAIDKAVRNAKKNMIKLSLKDGVLPHDVRAKYKSSEVVIRPVRGKGLAAGGAVRTVLEFAGMKEAGGKILTRSKNHINNAKATIIALEPFSEKVEVNLNSEKKKTFGRRKNFKNNKRFSKSRFEKKTEDSKKIENSKAENK